MTRQSYKECKKINWSCKSERSERGFVTFIFFSFLLFTLYLSKKNTNVVIPLSLLSLFTPYFIKIGIKQEEKQYSVFKKRSGKFGKSHYLFRISHYVFICFARTAF